MTILIPFWLQVALPIALYLVTLIIVGRVAYRDERDTDLAIIQSAVWPVVLVLWAWSWLLKVGNKR